MIHINESELKNIIRKTLKESFFAKYPGSLIYSFNCCTESNSWKLSIVNTKLDKPLFRNIAASDIICCFISKGIPNEAITLLSSFCSFIDEHIWKGDNKDNPFHSDVDIS